MVSIEIFIQKVKIFFLFFIQFERHHKNATKNSESNLLKNFYWLNILWKCRQGKVASVEQFDSISRPWIRLLFGNRDVPGNGRIRIFLSKRTKEEILFRLMQIYNNLKIRITFFKSIIKDFFMYQMEFFNLELHLLTSIILVKLKFPRMSTKLYFQV